MCNRKPHGPAIFATHIFAGDYQNFTKNWLSKNIGNDSIMIFWDNLQDNTKQHCIEIVNEIRETPNCGLTGKP